ncbi:G2/mitotic-specific cyclin [Thoreauomyces humboldtii]|nr:G2/mitotic-specific cyclin [Thoreauomyces humboldtii]
MNNVDQRMTRAQVARAKLQGREDEGARIPAGVDALKARAATKNAKAAPTTRAAALGTRAPNALAGKKVAVKQEVTKPALGVKKANMAAAAKVNPNELKENKEPLVKKTKAAPVQQPAQAADDEKKVKAVRKQPKAALEPSKVLQELVVEEVVEFKAGKTAPPKPQADVKPPVEKENRARGLVPKHTRAETTEAYPAAKKVKTVVQKEEEYVTPREELDADDIHDPMMVHEYTEDIFKYLGELEERTMPNPNYIDIQADLNWSMRYLLVDWLIDVSSKFHLLPETLFMTVNIVDRFLSDRPVSMNKLQLVGLAAMFIAGKYEEVQAPGINAIAYMADGGFKADDIMKAERYILQILKFNLHYPSPMSFLRRCSKADNYDATTRTLAKYLMEISLIDHNFLDIRPSRVAAAGLYLARRIAGKEGWNVNFVFYSGYSESEVKEVAHMMVDYLRSKINEEPDSLHKKYTHRKFLKASLVIKQWIQDGYTQEF